MKKQGVVFSVVVGLLMATGSLWAHHSEAMLDKENLVILKGTITRHDFVNPHQLFRMKVKDDNGQFAIWIIQATPPGALKRVGWTKKSLMPGDEVSVTAYVCKDGRPCGSWVRIVKGDGTELPLPDFKKRFLGEYLVNHGSKLSAEEYALYKRLVEGVDTSRVVEAPRQAPGAQSSY